MTVKTITITLEAYDTLKKLKRGDESFSEAIMRTIPKRTTIADWLGALNQTPEEIEEQRRITREIRKQMGEKMQERINNVRSRY
ncbi:MAG: antitoxin VapB family protein [Candidatus Micrarchaeota archaeon]